MSNRSHFALLRAATFTCLGVLLLIPCLWVLFLGLNLAYGNLKVRGHQEFAASGVVQIEPAMQMNHLYADCRHFISYGLNNVPLFNSVAYFGGRYELTIQVPVDIESASSGATIGEPRFYLLEVGQVTVSRSGQIGARFTRTLTFGRTEWELVCLADGDFSMIGFNVNTTSAPNFQRYVDASRH
jgi:hypothetical protein